MLPYLFTGSRTVRQQKRRNIAKKRGEKRYMKTEEKRRTEGRGFCLTKPTLRFRRAPTEMSVASEKGLRGTGAKVDPERVEEFEYKKGGPYVSVLRFVSH